MQKDYSDGKSRVRDACTRLVYELDIEANRKNPYFLPYTNYVMSWCDYIPINTLIIGQNPYPQDIYPEYGAAFAYDKTKSYCPQSVRVLARDVHNYNSTDIQLSMECFGDSWKLLEVGVILINETVYDKICGNKKNSRAIKEMEAQCRAIQVVLGESFLCGQNTMTCIGMGIPAASMTSIIRSWYPKDLFKMKVITCKNPAARDIGDMPSHQITIGKTAVSKVLSEIVESYRRMPPYKQNAQDKRRKQNITALKEGTENLSISADSYSNELVSFEDRLRSSREGGSSASTLEEILNSSGSLRKAIDKHKNAVMSHNITLLMIVESLDRGVQTQDGNKMPVSAPVPIAVGRPGNARRRVVRTNTETSKIDSVPELIEPETIPEVVIKTEHIVSSPAPSRARRRVRTSSAYEPSNAGTEYTIVSAAGIDKGSEISTLESISMKVFANWCNDNSGDPVHYELLQTAAESRTVLSPLVNSLVLYIRERKEADTDYDAYEELSNPDSASSLWAKKNIMSGS